jgi:hypothetical protein
MSRDQLRALPGGPLVRKYQDKNGVNRCVGLKDKLKSSQPFSYILAIFEFIWGGFVFGPSVLGLYVEWIPKIEEGVVDHC